MHLTLMPTLLSRKNTSAKPHATTEEDLQEWVVVPLANEENPPLSSSVSSAGAAWGADSVHTALPSSICSSHSWQRDLIRASNPALLDAGLTEEGLCDEIDERSEGDDLMKELERMSPDAAVYEMGTAIRNSDIPHLLEELEAHFPHDAA